MSLKWMIYEFESKEYMSLEINNLWYKVEICGLWGKKTLVLRLCLECTLSKDLINKEVS